MAGPHIEVRDNPQRDRYEVFVDDESAGFTAYRLSAGGITFLHTEVADRFEGHGVGSAFARGLLDDARRRGLRVTPLCPFVADYIRRHPENLGLVDDDWVQVLKGPGPPADVPGSPDPPARDRS